MSFQAYPDTVKAKTGKTPAELKTAADWPKAEYGVGHGHAMAVWAVFKDNGWTHAPRK